MKPRRLSHSMYENTHRESTRLLCFVQNQVLISFGGGKFEVGNEMMSMFFCFELAGAKYIISSKILYKKTVGLQ